MNTLTGHDNASVLVVGTAPPTRCGLATYTHSLSTALASTDLNVRILRVLDDNESTVGEPQSVANHWRRQRPKDVSNSSTLANEFDAVLLQHEFGIYPGANGIDVLSFLNGVNVPVTSVLHTVIANPDSERRQIINLIAQFSSSLVVHSQTARSQLISDYNVDASQVRVIPHGAVSRIGLSQPLNRITPSILTWGLLGPGKGIEHGIKAISILRNDGIDVEYIISGATHPNVLRDSGDSYRYELANLARSLGVDDLVRFDNHYRSREEQDHVIQQAAVVLLPYDSREQVTSGVLVEALAAGKPIIATRFPHAMDLSDSGGLELVDHQDAAQIAGAVARILFRGNTYNEMRAASWVEGLRHDWRVVGPKFRDSLFPVFADAVAFPEPLTDQAPFVPSIEEAVA